MKKIIISLMIILLSLISHASYANYKLSKSDIITINKINKKIEKVIQNDPLKYKKILIKQLSKVSKRLKKWSKKQVIIETLLESTWKQSLKKHYNNHYSKYNINFSKVKNDWLEWHNKARSDLLINSYSYADILSDTAYEWSVENMKKSDQAKYQIAKIPIDEWYSQRLEELVQ